MELLESLKNKNMKIAVLTNKPHNRAIDVVTGLFGKNYFDIVLGQSDDFERKPSPQGALIISKEFNVKPEQCVYLGDTNTDMITGKSAGMFTVVSYGDFVTDRNLLTTMRIILLRSP